MLSAEKRIYLTAETCTALTKNMVQNYSLSMRSDGGRVVKFQDFRSRGRGFDPETGRIFFPSSLIFFFFDVFILPILHVTEYNL